MQTSANLPALPPACNAAGLIDTPASAERCAATMETSVTTGLIAATCTSLLLGVAILVLAAIAPAGHDVPDANSFVTFP